MLPHSYPGRIPLTTSFTCRDFSHTISSLFSGIIFLMSPRLEAQISGDERVSGPCSLSPPTLSALAFQVSLLYLKVGHGRVSSLCTGSFSSEIAASHSCIMYSLEPLTNLTFFFCEDCSPVSFLSFVSCPDSRAHL